MSHFDENMKEGYTMLEDDFTYINTEEIERYLYKSLLAKGFIPEEVELEVLADIFIDYLSYKGALEEETEEGEQ
jgi:hypothetical protein